MRIALTWLGCLTIVLGLGVAGCGDDSGSANDNLNNENVNDNVSQPECGNGVVEDGEACDDGAGNSDANPDACRTDCRLPYCGDGVTDDGEECDDGNLANEDACLTACEGGDDCCVVNVCGDGYQDLTPSGSWLAEACDDGNTEGGDDCRGDCGQYLPDCGDGVQHQGEACDDGGANSATAPNACRPTCQPASCGDAVLDTDEECDDGNLVNADGCSSGCTLDAALWRSVSTGQTDPGTLGEPAMAYDVARDRMVLFGGWCPGTVFGDTWELDGSTWSQVTTAVAPAARSEHTMTYDASRNVVVLFGGFDTGSNDRNDLWEYDGTDWVQRNIATPPPARSFHAMVYDSHRGVHVLFGGIGSGGDLGDTWEYDGTMWVVKYPSLAPPARAGHGMAYDSHSQRVVLFGGDDSWNGEFGDTWEYDGTDWVQRSPTATPGSRSYHQLGYHEARRRVVVYGGADEDTVTTLADTWEWNGVNWVENSMSTVPPDRSNYTLAYDSARLRLVLYGGHYWTGSLSCRHDTWEYHLQSYWPDEQCDNGMDDDTDTLVDCDDPDCADDPNC